MKPLLLSCILAMATLPVAAQTTGSVSEFLDALNKQPGGSDGAAPASGNVTGADPALIQSLLQDAGYRAEVTTDSTGDPLIRSAGAGANYSIYFYGCTNNRDCSSIQFSAGFDIADGTTMDVVNDWNTTKRYGKVYLDDEMDPFIEMDINLRGGGITPEAFRDYLEVWDSLLADFQRHINW